MNLNSDSRLLLEQYLDEKQREDFERLFSDRLLLSEQDFKSKVKAILFENKSQFIGPKGEDGSIGPIGPKGDSIDVDETVKRIITQLKNDDVFYQSIIEKVTAAGSWWYSGSGLNEDNAKEIAFSQIKSGRISGSLRISQTPYVADENTYIFFVYTDEQIIEFRLIEGFNGRQFRIINCGSRGNWVEIIPFGSELLFGENESFLLYDGEVIDLCYDSMEGWR